MSFFLVPHIYARSYDRFFLFSSPRRHRRWRRRRARSIHRSGLPSVPRRRLQLYMYEGWFDEAVLAPSGSQVTLTEGEEAGGKGGSDAGAAPDAAARRRRHKFSFLRPRRAELQPADM